MLQIIKISYDKVIRSFFWDGQMNAGVYISLKGEQDYLKAKISKIEAENQKLYDLVIGLTCDLNCIDKGPVSLTKKEVRILRSYLNNLSDATSRYENLKKKLVKLYERVVEIGAITYTWESNVRFDCAGKV